MRSNLRRRVRHALAVACALTMFGPRIKSGCFRSDDSELRHQCALPTCSRIRRGIFPLDLWQLPERGAECCARTAVPLVVYLGLCARALRADRQLWRIRLLFDPPELRGCGAGCASVFWASRDRKYSEVLSCDVGGWPGTPYNTLSDCLEARAKATRTAICINRLDVELAAPASSELPATGGIARFYLMTSEGGQGTAYNTLSECLEARAKASQTAICINK